ncbi:MAG: hypothetical protein ACXV76_11605 [Halobacteriota archaeon]
MTSCAEMQFINTLELAAMRGAVPDSQRELALTSLSNKEFARCYRFVTR